MKISFFFIILILFLPTITASFCWIYKWSFKKCYSKYFSSFGYNEMPISYDDYNYDVSKMISKNYNKYCYQYYALNDCINDYEDCLDPQFYSQYLGVSEATGKALYRDLFVADYACEEGYSGEYF